MLFYTGLLLLVVAVSLDGFGVGITYGMRKIHVPAVALCIIMLCSGGIVLLAMTIGTGITSLLSPDITRFIGGGILIAIGSLTFYNNVRSGKAQQQNHNAITTVLTDPNKADLDKSGNISSTEALLLGAALALDAFGAGIGASMLGYPPVFTAILVACMSGVFLFSGINLGLYLAKNKQMQQMSLLPSVLLITIGVCNIFL
ncbi:membrane protein [Oceanobacillus picturae]|uniref:Membrane protein n=1 Tax=Oceanobacillus picturae TaxID=171693 RepID=W9AKC3_9BACI|nr:sporulation membrane protein YtaF [Oceanobacillus picturae]GAQ16462.1 membrane protein [Oceanobacillus picturae]CDO03367.1 putative sporulation protein YtaF [Oceanobacillus picturae]